MALVTLVVIGITITYTLIFVVLLAIAEVAGFPADLSTSSDTIEESSNLLARKNILSMREVLTTYRLVRTCAVDVRDYSVCLI
jgi:hypothetical protein